MKTLHVVKILKKSSNLLSTAAFTEKTRLFFMFCRNKLKRITKNELHRTTNNNSIRDNVRPVSSFSDSSGRYSREKPRLIFQFFGLYPTTVASVLINLTPLSLDHKSVFSRLCLISPTRTESVVGCLGCCCCWLCG